MQRLFGFRHRWPLGFGVIIALTFTSMFLLNACSIAPHPHPIFSPQDEGGMRGATLPEVNNPSSDVITQTAGVALFHGPGTVREFSLYPIQIAMNTRELATMEAVTTLSNTLSNLYTGTVSLEFALLHGEESKNEWILVYEPELAEIPLSANWAWSDFMITNMVGLMPSQEDVPIPADLLLGFSYRITEPISLTAIMNSERRPDLLSSITKVLEFTKSSPEAAINPGSIARLVFTVGTVEGRKRVVYYSDRDKDGALPPSTDGPYCVSNIDSVYCRIVAAYNEFIGQ